MADWLARALSPRRFWILGQSAFNQPWPIRSCLLFCSLACVRACVCVCASVRLRYHNCQLVFIFDHCSSTEMHVYIMYVEVDWTVINMAWRSVLRTINGRDVTGDDDTHGFTVLHTAHFTCGAVRELENSTWQWLWITHHHTSDTFCFCSFPAVGQ